RVRGSVRGGAPQHQPVRGGGQGSRGGGGHPGCCRRTPRRQWTVHCRVLTLGDSTYGPVVQDYRATTDYRSELERLLTWANVPHVPPMDRSVVGSRVGDLLPYVRPIIDTDHPDIVIVAFGTND